MPLRVGAPPYLVARPLTFGLEKEPGIELVYDTPARLVEGLRAGMLDVALASSIELFRRPGYTIVPGLCIGADGEVGSVKLYTRVPRREIRRVALDPASESAQALVRILVAEWTRGQVEYREFEDGEPMPPAGADAYLRIGDAALRGPEPAGFEAIDLACAWKELTGLPFVFALWIVRPGVELGAHEAAFARAASRGLAARTGIAEEAAAAGGLSVPFVRRYLLETCRFDLGDDAVAETLGAFRDRAAELRLVDAPLRSDAVVSVGFASRRSPTPRDSDASTAGS